MVTAKQVEQRQRDFSDYYLKCRTKSTLKARAIKAFMESPPLGPSPKADRWFATISAINTLYVSDKTVVVQTEAPFRVIKSPTIPPKPFWGSVRKATVWGKVAMAVLVPIKYFLRRRATRSQAIKVLLDQA